MILNLYCHHSEEICMSLYENGYQNPDYSSLFLNGTSSYVKKNYAIGLKCCWLSKPYNKIR